ncbi:GntR family transcriptional regulator [Dactylosporangium sp. CA-092794]|uniref:GntR family transcriptional regulator n=1 Tax=Dactylosporangium sp. CA-092794 TaxID=3239929 RepID=UPI003D8C317D
MKAVDANDPRPPSIQIADDLRAQITSGDLAHGARLPSGRELSRGYGVALMTAQAALQRLRDEGLVYSTSRGFFVGVPDESASVADRLRELETEMRALRSRVEILESGR